MHGKADDGGGIVAPALAVSNDTPICRRLRENGHDGGFGLVTRAAIAKGAPVLEYVGEILTPEDADRRANDEYFFDTKVVPVDARKDGLHTVRRPCLRLIFPFPALLSVQQGGLKL